MKRKILRSIILLIQICFIAGCSGNKKSEEDLLFESLSLQLIKDAEGNEISTLEYGSEVTPISLVESYTGNLIVSNQPLDTSSLQEVEVVYQLHDTTKGGKRVEKEIVRTFRVEDTVPPVIRVADRIPVFHFDPLLLAKRIAVLDPVDGSDGVTYEMDDSAVDWEKEGIYPVKITARDSSGNTSEREFEIVLLSDDYTFRICYDIHPEWYQYGRIEYVEDYVQFLRDVNDDLAVNNGDVYNNTKDHYDSIEEFVIDGASFGQVFVSRTELYDSTGRKVLPKEDVSEEVKTADAIYEYLVENGYNSASEYDDEYQCIMGFTVSYRYDLSDENEAVYSVNDLLGGQGKLTYYAKQKRGKQQITLYDAKGEEVEVFSLKQ